MDFKYLDIVRELLSTIERDEGEHMARCVDVLYDCIWQKHYDLHVRRKSCRNPV